MSESLTALYLQNPQLANALRQRAYAQSLAQDATSGEPIRSPWQGVAKLANAGLAALLMNRGDESIQKLMDEQKASDAAGSAAAMALMSPDWGKVPAGQPNSDVAAVLQGKQPTATPQLGNALDNVPAAPAVIHINESSGSMQPGITGDGGKAAGPMQVHQAALDDVNKRYGTNYTHQDLINNPEIGKKVGDAYYAILRDQFGGDDQKATAAYNAGPGRVAAAVQAYGPDWMKGIPQATVDYVNRGQQPQGQPQPGAAPAQSPQIPGYDPQELARMQRHSQALLAEGTRLVGSSRTVDQNRGRVMIAQSNHIDSTIQAIQQRAMAYQMRDMKTITLQGPDGKSYVYENTPNGPGRQVGMAPNQESKSDDAEAGRTLLELRDKVASGTATKAELGRYELAYRKKTQDEIKPIPDPTDPTGQRQVLARVPGQTLSSDFPMPPSMAQAGSVIPGTAKTTPLTADQAKSAGYSDRMAAANQIIGKTTDAAMSRVQRGMAAIPGIGNSMVSPEFQQFEQAQRDFINAKLRQESGAAIADSEFENARKQYFPQPGDSPQVLAQKARNRELAIKGMAREAGPQYRLPEPEQPSTTGAPPPPPGFKVVN